MLVLQLVEMCSAILEKQINMQKIPTTTPMTSSIDNGQFLVRNRSNEAKKFGKRRVGTELLTVDDKQKHTITLLKFTYINHDNTTYNYNY